jgi:hypothetical protein
MGTRGALLGGPGHTGLGPNGTGSLSRVVGGTSADQRAVAGQGTSRLNSCYAKALAQDPDMSGTLKLHVVVKDDGSKTVTATKVAGLSVQVAECMRTVVATVPLEAGQPAREFDVDVVGKAKP